MEKGIAVCKFCGQRFYSEKQSEAELEKDAIFQCDCWQAEKERNKIKYIEKAKDELSDVFSFCFFCDKNICDEKTELIQDKLSSLFEHMVEMDITSVTAKISDVGKITMSVNSDGEIKIKRVVCSSVERKVSS